MEDMASAYGQSDVGHALRAALGTCGNCHHFEPLVRPERGWCHVHDAKRYIDDGCVKGWTAK